MEDIDTKKDFSQHTDEELLMEVIGENADLYFIHCCLGELRSAKIDA